MKKLLLFSVLFAFFSFSAEAKTLYVDGTSGNDSTSYTNNDEAHPWATIGRAAWGSTSRGTPSSVEAAQAGDVVRVEAGTYSINQATGERYAPIYNPVNEGNAGYGYITFIAQGTVILQSSTSGEGEPLIGSYGKDYIIWDGFTLDEADINTHIDSGMAIVWESNNIIFRNCIFKGAHIEFAADNNHSAIRLEHASHVTIERNTLYNITGNSGRNDAIITLYYSDNITIKSNNIYDGKTGIYFKGGPNPGPINVYLNLFYNLSGDAMALHCTQSGSIYQNIVRDCGAGINFMGFTGQGPWNFSVVNNTIDNCTWGVYLKGACAAFTNNLFWNNIVTNATTAIYSEDCSTPAGIDFEHNDYYDCAIFSNVGGNKNLAQWKSTFSQDSDSPASIDSDPEYIDESGNNFKLSESSPAKDAGVDILDLNNDGMTNDSINIGAYLTGMEKIGTRLLPPSRLLILGISF